VNMISLLVEFLVLRVMIRYHNMIPLSSLSSLIDAPHQLFACMKCMIQLMILALWLALGVYWAVRGTTKHSCETGDVGITGQLNYLPVAMV
jgi:hypothetical protein